MWSSIKIIHKPETWAEAWRLSQAAGTAVLSGGTYLAAERDPVLEALVSLKSLLATDIEIAGTTIRLGAGVTLQELVDFAWPEAFQPVAEAARASCSSKNIRNQRTLGGEIANFRFNSELVLLLQALNPRLQIVQNTETETSLREWAGAGIIQAVMLDLSVIKKMVCLRYAPIPSAVPFLGVAGVAYSDGYRIVVGGNVSGVKALTFHATNFRSEEQSLVMEQAENALLADHFGSRDYKRNLLQVALRRLGEALCQ